MTTEAVEERLNFLVKFLMLPDADRQVKNLSGGQQRRVSFAATLLHEPELLILDEPTVGVDPLLRQNIWDHLVKITKNGRTTVIITTHYIDETRQAHLVSWSNSYFLVLSVFCNVLILFVFGQFVRLFICKNQLPSYSLQHKLIRQDNSKSKNGTRPP